MEGELGAVVEKGTNFDDDIMVVVVGWVYLDGRFILEMPMSEGSYVQYYVCRAVQV